MLDLLNSFKPLLKLLLIVAPVLAVLLIVAILAVNKNKESTAVAVPTATQTPGGEPTQSGCPQEGHIKSPSSFNKANITFDNQTGGDLKIYWIDFQGKRKFYSNLKAHTKYDQATWIGHVWVVADSADQCIKLESANAVQQMLVIN